MIEVLREEKVQAALDYIENDYQNCLYLYLNLIKYRTSSPNITTYLDLSRDGIQAIYLCYFDCVHFYSCKPDYPASKLFEMLQTLRAKTAYMPQHWGTQLQERMQKEGFTCTSMDVVTAKNHLNGVANASSRIERSELEEFADFLLTDPAYYNIYDRAVLVDQLIDRYDSGYSRYHVMRMDGEMVACYGTNAENEQIALMGGLLVSKKYRKRGYGSNMILSVWNEVLAEGKMGFAFIGNPESMRLHRKLGCMHCATVTKFHS